MQNRWREADPDVEIDLRAANLKDADLTGVHLAEAKKGATVAVKVTEMRGEEVFVVKHV